MTGFDPEAARADFPALRTRGRGRSPVYMDTACMALKPRPVIDALCEYYEDFPGCHGRTFHEFGRRTTREVDAARRRVRRFVGAAEEAEIIFLRNVTEGINMLARGLRLGPGDTVVTTGMEHNSNLLPWQREARRRGFEHLIVPLTPDGELDRDAFSAALADAPVKLVSTFHTSNVTGVTLPAEWIVDQAHRQGAAVAFDGAQAVPHSPVDVRALGADFYVFSFYKMMGPTGVACMYGRRELLEHLDPPLVGGEGIEDTTYQSYVSADLPDRLEPGLQHYAGILGAAAAVDYLDRFDRAAIAEHERELNTRLTNALETMDGVRIIGPADPALRGAVVNFTMASLDAIEVAHLLDTSHDLMLRAGKHCAHSWYNASGTPDSLRASVYLYNTVGEVDLLVSTLDKIARDFR